MFSCSCLVQYEVLDPNEMIPEKQFIAKVLRRCEEFLCLDNSRKDFIEESSMTVHQLATNRIFGTRHNRTLIGRKNIGKTLLLTTLSSVIKEYVGGMLVINIKCDRHHTTPRLAMCEQLNIRRTADLDCIEMTLKTRNIKVFLVIDDFNMVYTERFTTNGRDVIRDVLAIGGSTAGCFFCILSGSSSILRSLITAKVTDEEVKQHHLVNYTGCELNETKFSVRTILPFNRQSDLVKIKKFFTKQYPSTAQDDITIETIVLETGGHPGLIHEFFRSSKFSTDKYTIGLRGLATDSKEYAVLLTLMKISKELQLSREVYVNSDTQSDVFTWMELINVDNVHRSMGNPNLLDYPLLFEMSDLGYLVFEEVASIRKVGFYSPRIYLELVAQSGSKLTITELLALRNPVNMYEAMAEFVMAKILMGAKTLLSRVFHIDELSEYENGTTQIPELLLPDTSADARSVSSEGETTPTVRVVPRGIFLKECFGATKKRDTLGADFVFVEHSGIVHRIQLKLGTGTLAEKDFDAIAKNFKSKLSLATAAYERVGLSLSSVRHYLITTRSYKPADGRRFEGGGNDGDGLKIVLVGNETLHECDVWPDQAKDLGKPFRDPRRRK